MELHQVTFRKKFKNWFIKVIIAIDISFLSLIFFETATQNKRIYETNVWFCAHIGFAFIGVEKWLLYSCRTRKKICFNLITTNNGEIDRTFTSLLDKNLQQNNYIFKFRKIILFKRNTFSILFFVLADLLEIFASTPSRYFFCFSLTKVKLQYF